jgi:hypothetical protein
MYDGQWHTTWEHAWNSESLTIWDNDILGIGSLILMKMWLCHAKISISDVGTSAR